ncbi:MAG: hypothetical protein DRQ56_07810 [Gammaproteobacteria bacterium]|nr:MAG: hypothetical protein DRQ56_07810 [Gammaproteobacteria bacterium]
MATIPHPGGLQKANGTVNALDSHTSGSPAHSCGRIGLSCAAGLSLHIIGRIQGAVTAQAVDKPLKVHQVTHAKQCAAPAQNKLRVWINEVRPLRRNRMDKAILRLQEKPGAISVVPLANAHELSPEIWMEWMCHTHKMRCWIRSVCILD